MPLIEIVTALLHTPTNAGLGPEERGGTLSEREIDARLGMGIKEAKLNAAAGDLIRAIIYLWHDHLDGAHAIAQGIETPDGSLVHAMMHRREPDYVNSKYWFRRAGKHPSFLKLAVDAEDFLARADETALQTTLLPNRTWDPFAFVDAVEDAAKGQFKSKVEALEQLQRLEFEALLENLTHRAMA